MPRSCLVSIVSCLEIVCRASLRMCMTYLSTFAPNTMLHLALRRLRRTSVDVRLRIRHDSAWRATLSEKYRYISADRSLDLYSRGDELVAVIVHQYMAVIRELSEKLLTVMYVPRPRASMTWDWRHGRADAGLMDLRVRFPTVCPLAGVLPTSSAQPCDSESIVRHEGAVRHIDIGRFVERCSSRTRSGSWDG